MFCVVQKFDHISTQTILDIPQFMGISVKSNRNQLFYKNALKFNILKFLVFKKIGFLIAGKCCSQNFCHGKNQVFIKVFFFKKSLEIFFACLNKLLICIVSVTIVLLCDYYFFDKIKVQCKRFSYDLIKTGSIQLLYHTKH